MENNSLSQQVFTLKTITIATFFGGPLVASFLIAKNYSVFGERNSAYKSIILGVATTSAIMILLLLLPESILDKIPHYLFPFIYTAIISVWIKKYQQNKIDYFLANDGKKASNWIAFLYGLFGLVVIVLFAFIFSYNTLPEGYDHKIVVRKNMILYYKKDVSENISQKIANELVKLKVLDSGTTDLFLATENNSYQLRFVLVDESQLNDKTSIITFNVIEQELNKQLKLDKKITIGFINSYLTKTYNLTHIKHLEELLKNNETLYGLKEYKISQNKSIYYNDLMPIRDVKIVSEAIKRLISYFPDEDDINIVFVVDNDRYTLKFFIDKVNWYDDKNIDLIQKSVQYFKDSGINHEIDVLFVDINTNEEFKLLNLTAKEFE